MTTGASRFGKDRWSAAGTSSVWRSKAALSPSRPPPPHSPTNKEPPPYRPPGGCKIRFGEEGGYKWRGGSINPLLMCPRPKGNFLFKRGWQTRCPFLYIPYIRNSVYSLYSLYSPIILRYSCQNLSARNAEENFGVQVWGPPEICKQGRVHPPILGVGGIPPSPPIPLSFT